MINRYLETKFHIPPWRSSGVPRQRLLDRLQTSLSEGHKLTLVSAPAGYGKTTLVAEWIDGILKSPHDRILLAWIALDEADNDPARFLGYWMSSLSRVDEMIGQSTRSLLGSSQLPPLNAIFDELINELVDLSDPLVLILDDYHVITNPLLHEALEYFIEHQPSQMHIVLTTREDPPFPLARLRARGQMTEVRATDLRFTIEEALQFFNQSMKLALDVSAINMLETRTEGWAAGMQLAALALQNLPDQQDFLTDFSGSHRYIIDYLLDEVLKHQPLEIRAFLSKTAVLKRFNAELCQAVTGNTASISILNDLERSNLFLIPLDDQRGWYRYHHLFADVLRVELDPETERGVHEAAAAWYEAEGLFAEAIAHWLAVSGTVEAARLIDLLAPSLLKNGELQTLLGWLRTLPEEVFSRDPELLSYKALSLMLTGQIALARVCMDQVPQLAGHLPEDSGSGRLLTLQSWLATTGGDSAAGTLATRALDLLNESDVFFRLLALISLGSSRAWDADLPASNEVFREAYQLGKQLDQKALSLGMLANLVFNLLEQGRLREAELLCRTVMEEYRDRRGKHLPVLGIIYIPLAAVCYEKGALDEAQDLAQRGVELCQRLFSSVMMGGDAEIILARIAFEQGHQRQAIELLQTTAHSAQQHNLPMMTYKMMVAQVELYLWQGSLVEAENLLTQLNKLVQSNLPKAGQVVAHLQARYLAASGQPERALEILADLESADKAEGSLRRLIGVYLTQSLVYQEMGDTARAAQIFEAALRLAVPEGYYSVFFPHDGRPTRPLLQAARTLFPEFVDGILGATQLAIDIPQGLIDPLSDQELKVLKLLASGRSNQEIAAELVISVGTAKWHVHNVLQKLGANNRAQAILRAQELGLER